VDSDDDYVQDVDDDDDDFVVEDDGPVSGYTSKSRGKSRAKKKSNRGKERWESSIQKDFGAVEEGEDGKITESLEGLIEARKRKRLRQDTKPFQRGIIRHVCLVLDLSEAMLEKDMRPNRFIVMLNYIQEYIREFFEQNPISQLCIMAMHDGLCIRISELGGNPTDHIAAIQSIRHPRNPRDAPKEPKGNPSLQNALELSRAALYHTPSHGTREVIIVLGALLSLDPGDIYQTIRACVRDQLRVSIIGMGGRLRICQEICARTNAGDDSVYGVALDQQHLRDLLLATTTPPVIRTVAQSDSVAANSNSSAPAASTPASLLMMGFPSRVTEEKPTLCACHATITRGGYTCSRCEAKVCSLPATCPSCHLTLILSTHLARSYHHLFPLRNWVEVSWQRAQQVGSTQCKGCLNPFPSIPKDIAKAHREALRRQSNEAGTNGVSNNHDRLALHANVEGALDGAAAEDIDEETILRKATEGASESSRYECESCGNHFCIDCDLFCHEVAHNCPGCLSGPALGGVVDLDGQNGQEPMQVD
jgi:transcription initiation factor TFIIH subunit 2